MPQAQTFCSAGFTCNILTPKRNLINYISFWTSTHRPCLPINYSYPMVHEKMSAIYLCYKYCQKEITSNSEGNFSVHVGYVIAKY